MQSPSILANILDRDNWGKVATLTPKKLIKNESGMSLPELVIVMGIIGVLSYIGNAQYGKYRAKANLSQGKVEIMQIYAAMRTFESHFNSFFADWRNLGYQYNGTTNARFGLSGPGPVAPANYRGPGAAPGGAATIYNSVNGCAGPECEEHPSLACALPGGCTAAAGAFTLCASSREDTGGGSTTAAVAQLDQTKTWAYTTSAGACP